MRVYTARWLLPVASPAVPDGAVAVDAAGRIAYVGPAAGAPPGLPHPLGGAVLLPGLVAVRIPPDPAPARTPARPLAPGVTTLATTIASDADLAVLLASGARAIAYHPVVGPSPADREPALAALRTGVARTRSAVAAAGATDRVRLGVAPGPVDAIHEDLLLDACAWAVGENLPLAIPAGANAAEVAYVREAAGPHADRHRAAGRDVVRRAHSTVHLLAELGVAAVARPLLVGGAFFDDSDVALAAYYGCPVAYAPFGTPPVPCPLPALLDAGACLALAADPDLLTTADELARTPAEALHLVTLGAARALRLETEIGSLEVGKSADLCAFPLDAADLRAAEAHGPEHVLLAHPGRAPLQTTVQGVRVRLPPAHRPRNNPDPSSFLGAPIHPTPHRETLVSDRTNGRTTVIWRDGQIIPWEQATLHVMSHVVHYGSSVFEGIRCYETPSGPAVFRLREHVRRLLDSCKIYRMPMRWSLDELVQGTVDLVAANELRACYLRPLVVRAGEQMGVNPLNAPVETFLIAWHWGTYLGHTAMAEGVDVCVSSWRRPAPGTFPTLAKAGGNYLNSQLTLMEARADGYAEGIALDSFGYVSEGSGENLFIVRDGVLWTTGLESAILEGITRDSVLAIARDMGIEVRMARMPRELLLLADEMFFTGTAAEITPIRSVDRQPVGEGKPGPITRAIQDRYMGIAGGRYPDVHGWLTPVPVRETAGV